MLAPPPLPRTLDAALRDVTSEKPRVRASAISDLARHGQLSDDVRTRVIPIVERALTDGVNIVRSAAAIALADLHATEALPALLVAVEDADAHVRQMALSALGEIGDPRAGPRLERALTDERPEVRYQAVIAFTRVMRSRPEEITPALVRALRDDDADIRYIGLRLAEEETPPNDGALAELAGKMMEGTDHGLALCAAMYLLKRSRRCGDRSRDPRARAILTDVVRGKFSGIEREDEKWAVELAGELALKDLIPDLERRAYGVFRIVRETNAWHAKIALARMRHARAEKEILSDLGSWRRETRQAAVVAAGRARLTSARALLLAMDVDSVDPGLVGEAIALLDASSDDSARDGARRDEAPRDDASPASPRGSSNS